MAAIVKFSCPSCGVILKNTNPQMAGKTIKCPKCSKPVLVPGNTKAIASIRHLPGPSMGTSVPILPQPAAAPALKPLDPNAQPVKIGAKDGSPPPEPLAFAGEKPRKPEAPEPPPAPTPEELPVESGEAPPEEEAPTKAKKRKRSKVVGLFLFLLVVVLLGGAGIGTWYALENFPGLGGSVASSPGTTPPAGPVASTPATQPVKKEVDPIAFVAADFSGAVILYPVRILKSPMVAPLLKDEMFAEIIKETGVDPRKVAQVVVLLDPFPGGKPMPPKEGDPKGEPKDDKPGDQPQPTPGSNLLFSFTAVVRFTEPVDGKKLLAQAMKGTTDATFQGKTYQVGKDGPMANLRLSGHVVDDRTLLVGPEPTLQKSLAVTAPKGPLVDRMRQLDRNNHLVVLFVVDQVRDVASGMLKQSKDQIPEKLAAAGTLAERLQSGSLALNLTGDVLLKLTLEANNDESAGVIEGLARSGLELLKPVYPALREGLKKDAPPDLLPLLQGILDQLEAGIQVSKDGPRVVLSLARPKGWEKSEPKP